MSDFDPPLDPGIEKAVIALREAGLETFESCEGETVWEGEVLVLKLSGHPTAGWCFAWEVGGEITAELAEGPVQTPVDAVKASIYADGMPKPEG